MSGTEVYLEEPVKPKSYVTAVCRLLGLKPPEDAEQDEASLRAVLIPFLADADPEDLNQALAALKKKD